MGLFFYYAWHSLKNQLKKIFKTWVLVFILVCGLIGGLIGYGAASLEEMAEENAQETEEYEEPVYQAEITADLGISGQEALELGLLAISTVVLSVSILNAEKNGTKLFLPADVTLLFASPMKPQSVLMFRLATQLSTALAGSIYLLFQLPNLMLNMGLSLWCALSLFAVWFFIMIFGKLVQMLLYLLEAEHGSLKNVIRTGLYAVFGIVTAGFILYSLRSDASLIEKAVSYFNAPVTRWIPVIGWIKGFSLSVFENRPLYALLYGVLLLASAGIILWVISRMDVDFYEDAMKSSEETAQLIEKVQNSRQGITFAGKRKFDSNLDRGGFTRGSGPNVYFFKTLYNRFRFAKFRFFTKTMITYILACAALGVVMRVVVQSDSVLPMMFLLAAMVFFRSLGNPMNEDVQQPYFALIPESTFKKLFFSLAGGTVSCFLDVLPAVLIGTLITGGSLLSALLWMIPVMTVDFYATCVGTFLDLSIPESIGKTVKQVIQIMFIYFGLLPDIALIAIGFVQGSEFFAAASVSFVNAFLGFLFFGLAGVCADPAEGKNVIRIIEEGDPLRKIWSWLGICLSIILVVTGAVQIGVGNLLKDKMSDPIVMYLVTFLPLYGIAIPAGILLMRRYRRHTLPKRSLPLRYWFVLPLIAIFIMYTGNLVGTVVNAAVSRFLHSGISNPMNAYVLSDNVWLRILFLVILAPLIEEYIFRKQLIDRTAVYDERSAVLLSGILFGLFHGNFSQMFYAAGLGILFGVIYVRTGKLRYTVILHMAINFMGAVLAPHLLKNLSNLDGLTGMTFNEVLSAPQVVIFLLYISALILMCLAGIVFYAYEKKNFSFVQAERQTDPEHTLRRYFTSPGMVLFAACVLLLVVLNLQ
ncbi:MAG: CPBP family intramembrane metalloprotease [Solobacterium sp.]|nr:CPBP family intramembrane metalloprotease [Solobacterium sp.]